MLSKEIASSLRGRAWTVVLHPFGFEEALRHAGAKVPAEPMHLGSREVANLERSFLAHLEVGGFPEAQGLEAASRATLLRDDVDVVLLRDVIERHAVRQVEALRWLVRRLLGNAAGSFSAEKCYSALRSEGFAVTKDSVHALLAHLEDCFLIRCVWMDSGSERQRMVNPRKVYPIDTGLIPNFDRARRANLGHALETCVLLELERRRAEITYVRTTSGHEVDFLARFPAGAEALIPCCADASDPATAERESRALDEAHAMPPHARRLWLRATRG
jgi:predicted AAA+ superfamily ATPase